MDRYSGKKAPCGVVPKKGSGIGLKDIAKNTDHRAQFCSRLGCSGRIKCTKITKNGSSVKVKCLRPSMHSSNDKKIIGNPSRTCPVVTNAKKSGPDSKRKFSSQLDIDPSESSASGETPDSMPSPSRTQTAHHSESRDAKTRKGAVMDTGSSRVTSTIKPKKISNRNSGSCSEYNQLDSIPPVSASSGLRAKNCSSSRSRYGLRSLKCNSMSDVIAQSFSTSDSKPNTKDVVKKGNPGGQSISSPGSNQTTAASSIVGNVAPSNSGISISSPRHNRSWAHREEGNGVASVRTRRLTNINTTQRHSNQQDGNGSSLREPVFRNSQLRQPELPVDAGGHNSSQHFSANVSSINSSSYSLSSSNGNNLSSVMPAELGITHLMDHMTLQRLNIGGIAEVLLSIGRLEQDEELISEHISALEISLLSGLSHFYDQHRDMRLDIDNMSYEELLALEERIGTVSTALSEEELTKCLRKSCYQAIPCEVRNTGSLEDDNDAKCCICQEEYGFGNEIGTLGCQHGYHMACVVQWLRLKNWCPVCKISASPSQPS